MKMQKKMEKLNYVVWPAPSSKFLKMARGPNKFGHPWFRMFSLFFCTLNS